MGIRTRSFANNILSGGVFDATDLDGALPSSNIDDTSVTNITAVPALVATTTVASDPPSPDAGQVWYNSTDRVLRGYVLSAGSWASGGSLNTARDSLYSTGSQTANLVYSGQDPSGNTVNVESYDGSSWTEIANVNTALRSGASAGTSTSALKIDGYTGTGASGTVESWNGSAWTEITELNTSRFDGTAAGASDSAAIAFGGSTPTRVGNNESWNGSAWTELNDMVTVTSFNRGGGTQTAALSTGGYVPPGSVRSGKTESWSGS